MKFTVAQPEPTLSPHTGMTREHWIQMGNHLLSGVFQHIQGLEHPIVMPKQDEITYPQPNDPPHRFQALEFEGLARTLMLAAPLIERDPSLRLHGLPVRDYYATQLRQATDPKHPRYLGTISQFTAQYGKMQYQHTVEGAALVIGLMLSRRSLWDGFDAAEKGRIAAFISDLAHSRTIAHNWRFFNVLMLTFLKLHGYGIDETALKDHLQHLLSNHVGNGWYVDDITYDFYNPWGFHFYGPIWCSWYGYEHEPEMARIFEERNRTFIQHYPRFFGRDAHQLMWGRSIIYRCGASAAFGAHFLMKDPVLDPGHARRIASGNLLQFLGRDDLYVNGVPCLGYYGPFSPLVQFYSCAASPFWIAKTFLALSLPDDNPFWTAPENEGFWPDLGDRTETVDLPGPGIQVANHGRTGTAEIRTAKVPKFDPYYNQLQFNTAFCLEAVSPEGANPGSYSLKELGTKEPFRIPLDIAFNRFADGVMYRMQNTQPAGLNDPNKGGVNKGPERIDLADILVPGGVIRVDRLRIPYCHQLHLGHFALPHLQGTPAKVDHFDVAGVPGIRASIPGRQVAMLSLNGFDGLASAVRQGMNPEAEHSTVLYAHRTREKDYNGMDVAITILLHRTDNDVWTDDELNPILEWRILPWAPSGQACGVFLRLKDGRSFTIDPVAPDGWRTV